jgi:hypothetical protein
MESNGTYNITKERHSELIYEVVERIHEESAELQGAIISWEEFTQEFMGFDMPTDDVERIRWVDFRPTWVKAINDAFIEAKYPYHLEIKHNMGVYLLVEKSAALKKISKRTKKQVSMYRNSLKEITSLLESGSYPTLIPAFKWFNESVRTSMFSFIGQIDTAKLPKSQKDELKRIVVAALPPTDPLKLAFEEHE